jgi:AcrR family transcriptional regulator
MASPKRVPKQRQKTPRQPSRSRKVLGSGDSETRLALIHAAEQLIREEGYSALTSRRIANKAGLKHQLIYYYFDTLDDLLLAVLEEGGERYRVRLMDALNAEHPLRALWIATRDQMGGTKFTNEFMVLASHNPALHAEARRQGQELRRVQAEVISRYLAENKLDAPIPPVLISVLMTALARFLVNESRLGVMSGHAEAEAWVEACIRDIEMGVPAANQRGRTSSPKRSARSREHP